MTEFVDVVEVNPVVFVNKIVEGITNGFYLQNTIAGYPMMGTHFEIRLFETDEPAVRNKLDSEIHTVVVEGYDVMQWLLDVQDVALQGFVATLEGMSVDNYKSITMVKPTPVTFDFGTAPEATTEAPKPKRASAKSKTKPTQEGE